MKNRYIFILIVLLDQLTKFLAAEGIILFDTRLISFTLVRNTGASFGILQGWNSYLIWISLIAIGALMYYYSSAPREFRLPLVTLGAGITGNLIDRVFLGYVVDFIDFHFFHVFNIADSAITLSIIALLWIELRQSYGQGSRSTKPSGK